MKILLAYIGDPSGTNYPLSLYMIRACSSADPNLQQTVDFSLHIFPHNVDTVEAADVLIELSPDLIALSCYVWNIKATLELCDKLKERSPRIPIVLGGPEVTPTARQILESNSSVDIVVTGEGEETFRELLLFMTLCGSSRTPFDIATSRELSTISGMSFRTGSVVHDTPRRPPVADLGKLPAVFDSAGSDTIAGHHAVACETFRGCPYSCSFCEWSDPGGSGPLRFAPMERIQNDIRLIMSNSIRELFFIDSALNVDPERAKTILRTIEQVQRETGSETMVGLHLGVERLDDELCELLARTQARTLVGLQTFGKAALAEANRKWFNRERFERGIELLQRHGVNIYNLQVIFGLPDDSYEQFRENVVWVLDRGIRIWTGPLLLLPGTDYARRSTELEIVADPEPPYQVKSSRGFSTDDMKRSAHLSTGLDFYNRLGPGAVKEGAAILALSPTDFLEKLGSWWSARNGKPATAIPPATLPGLFSFVSSIRQKAGDNEDPSLLVDRIIKRARQESHDRGSSTS